ncbi:unnamed protein product [Dicrocoelium dendriticum]|nr:unnamed protein product [Dicrocoelium dendriticum]
MAHTLLTKVPERSTQCIIVQTHVLVLMVRVHCVVTHLYWSEVQHGTRNSPSVEQEILEVLHKVLEVLEMKSEKEWILAAGNPVIVGLKETSE